MSDINQYLNRPGVKDPQRFDRETDIEYFDWDAARQRTQAIGIQMREEHCAVIGYLRNYYLRHGWPDHAYELTRRLDRAYADRGDKHYLCTLYPGGPIEQAGHIAGLPLPANLEEHSQGSVQ